MLYFSTDTIVPDHRFDHWREVRGKQLFGVTLELPAERRAGFQGWFRAHAVGPATASEMKASAYLVRRTEADIARIPGNSLCIGHQVIGPGLLRTGNDRTETIRSNDITISCSDLPYSAMPETDKDFHYRMLKIPFDDELTLGCAAHDLFATTIADVSLRRPLHALFNTLMLGGHAPATERQVADIARLALAARGRLPRSMPEVRAAMRSGILQAALQIMQRDKHEPGLTASCVAAELAVSRRQLYLLLEEAELSFGTTLSSMRIRAAHDLLIARPDLSVLQVALDCGFDSLATFYRAFNNAYAMPPRQVRATPANPPSPDDVGLLRQVAP